MQRLALTAIDRWYQQPQRKPLLIDGARQTGKTYLVESLFAPRRFTRIITLDFWKEPNLAQIFEGSLKPENILEEIELYFGTTLDLRSDLLFFDEIGHCQAAIDSLKYFAQERPDIWLCASGSNIGLLGSFPVGKVEFLHLGPMNFEEFLLASDNQPLLRAFQGRRRTKTTHDRLWEMMLDYWFVGGLPEVVAAWFDPSVSSKQQRIENIIALQDQLLAGYTLDFGKLVTPPSAALHIQTVLENIPLQLSRDLDGNAKRYQFNNVIKGKKGYQPLRGPIDALVKLCLVSKNFPIRCKPQAPLRSYSDENHFKLFMFDIGLLTRMLSYSYKDIQGQQTTYKGFLAENFVHNEWISGLPIQRRHTYSWKENTSEIEFLIAGEDGTITPVEVKSGKKSRRAKSLDMYCARYAPRLKARLIGGVGAGESSDTLTWPIYYATALKRTIGASEE